ncbi:MAG: cyclic nucleotide-binding domain-containing protein [Deltaproteobacteria bacterium]|jgi:CRP-like cAMP-binding protein|nr:cyclic nucleotide-binding domain-containing protein [Deltaproteobacteria bacterium]
MNNAVSLSGSLSFLNLGELLNLLGSNGSSGVLRIKSSYKAEAGLVYLDKGNPIDATNGTSSGIEAIFSLFGWTDGSFEFVEEEPTCQKTITKSRMEIILDGLRLLDEGKIEKLGPTATASTDQTEKTIVSGKVPLIKGPLVDYSYVVDEEGFYDGDEIVQEGNHGDWIWVILEGIAEISKKAANGSIEILRIGDGAFLGSVAALISGGRVRTATVTAVGNVQLGMLDSQLLANELANVSTDFKNILISVDSRLKQVVEMAVKIKQNQHDPASYIKGKKQLIKQGQDEDRLFAIKGGQVVIARQTEKGYVPLAQLKKGDFFGRIPFLDMGHEPYSAAVFSSDDLKLSAVDTKKLESEHQELSSTLRNIIEHLATAVSVSTRVTCDFQNQKT